MPDLRGSRVERWKLAPEEIALQRQLARLARVEQVVRGAAMRKTNELQRIQQIYKDLMISYEGALKAAPPVPLREIPGMDFKANLEQEIQGQTPEKMIQY